MDTAVQQLQRTWCNKASLATVHYIKTSEVNFFMNDLREGLVYLINNMQLFSLIELHFGYWLYMQTPPALQMTNHNPFQSFNRQT